MENSAPQAAPAAPAEAVHAAQPGLDGTRLEAARIADGLRPAIAKGLTGQSSEMFDNILYHDALAHTRGEPASDRLTRQLQARAPQTPQQEVGAMKQAPAAKPTEHESPFAKHWQPMTDTDVERVQTVTKVHGVAPAAAESFATFCRAVGLPAALAESLAPTFANHVRECDLSTPLSPDEAAEYSGELVRQLGGADKARAHIERARKYIASLGPEVQSFINGPFSRTSFNYEPKLVLALSSLAIARDIK